MSELNRHEQILQQAEEERQSSDSKHREILEIAEFERDGASVPFVKTVLGIPRGIARGITDAAANTMELVAELDEKFLLGPLTSSPGTLLFDADPREGKGGKQDSGFAGIGFFRTDENTPDLKSVLRIGEAAADFVTDLIPEPEHISGQLTEGASKVVSGLLGAGKFKWIKQLKKGGRFARRPAWLLQGAIADAAVWDGAEQRASDLLIQFDNPILNNTFTQYLAASTDENVSELEGRIKNILEGAALGAIIDATMIAFKLARQSKIAKDLIARRAQKRAAVADAEQLDRELNAADVKRLEKEGDAGPITGEDFGFDSVPDPITPIRSVEETISSRKSNFKVVLDNEDGIQILSHDINKVPGSVTTVIKRGEFLFIDNINLPASIRGREFELEVLVEGFNYAIFRGLRGVISSDTLSPTMYKAWRKAGKTLGFAVREAKTTIDDAGNFISGNNRPIFHMDDIPDGLKFKGDQRVNVKKIRLDATGDDDAIRSAVQRLIADGKFDDLITSIEKGDRAALIEMTDNQQHYIDWDSFSDDPKALRSFVQKFLDASAPATREAKLASGGPQTVQEITDRGIAALEKQRGDITHSLFRDVSRDGGLAGRVFGAAHLLQNSRASLFRLAELAEGGDKLAGAKLHQHINFHAQLEFETVGSSAHIGRAMRAHQITKKAINSPNFDLDEMLRESGQVGDMAAFAKKLLRAKDDAVSDLIAKRLNATFFDKLLEIMYGNTLSAPTTQAINLLGNIGIATWDLSARTLAGIPGGVARVFGKKLGGGLDEGFDAALGAWLGAYRGWGIGMRFSLGALIGDLKKAGGFSFKKLRSGELKQIFMDSEKVGRVYKALLSGEAQLDTLTKLSEAGSARKAIDFPFPKNWKSLSLMQNFYDSIRWMVENSIGPVIRIPGRLILTGDELFKGIANDIDRYSKTYADARTTAQLDFTKDSLEVHNITTRKMADWMLDPKPQGLEGAAAHNANLSLRNKEGVEFAREQTFQSRLQSVPTDTSNLSGRTKKVFEFLGKRADRIRPLDFFGSYEKLATEHKSLRLLTLFIRTPINLMVKSMELTPVTALLSSRFRAELLAGGARRNTAIAKLTMGAASTLWILDKFSKEEIVGGKRGANSQRLDGVDRYSVKFGDTWVNYDRLDPFGVYLGFTTDMLEMYAQGNLTPEMEEEAGAMFASFMAAFSANFTHKTYMRGLSEFFEAMTYAERGSSKPLEKFVGSTLMSLLLPGVGSNFERRRADGQEDFAKYIFTWMDEFVARIPKDGGLLGLIGQDGTIIGGTSRTRHDLGTRRDPLGRGIKIKKTLGFQSRLWNPIDVSSKSTKPVDLALAQMNFHITMPSRNMGGVPLTGVQYSKLLFLRGQEIVIAGNTLEQELSDMVMDELFLALGPLGQQDMVNDAVREYGRLATKQLRAEDQTLDDLILGIKQKRKDGLIITISKGTPEVFQPRALPPPQEPEQTGNILFQNVPARGSGERSLIIGNSQRS